MDICLTREDFTWHGMEQLSELPKDAANSCPICLDDLVNIVPPSSGSSKTETNTTHNDWGSKSKTAGTSVTGTTENNAANNVTASASVEANPEQISFVRTRSCGHIFHTECLQKWLSKNRTCPMCRKTLFYLSHSPDVDQAPLPVRRSDVENESPRGRRTSTSIVLLVALVWGCFGLLAALVVVLVLAFATFCHHRNLPAR